MSCGSFNIKKASKLDSEGRIKELRPYELLKDVAGVTNSMVCIDFGSGTGTFALPMAQCVGNEGKVYAVDNSAEMLEHIQQKKPPPNLTLVQRDVGRTGLDSQIADLCLLAFILHEVKVPSYIMGEAFRLLKPEGKVLVVEWKADLDSPGPPRKRRITKEQVEQLFRQAGLSSIEYIDWSRNHYVATGNKVKPS
jgi:ubiquinone/menaquinone biosynthesis C-methylase UbiE